MLPVIRSRNMMPNWIEEFFGNDFLDNRDSFVSSSIPSVNVIEQADNFLIEVAAPGLRKDDFNIELDNQVLKISSERKEEREEKKDEKILRREFSYSSFKRVFSLPESIEADKISAKHEDGILKVNIPKKDETKVKPIKQISIK